MYGSLPSTGNSIPSPNRLKQHAAALKRADPALGHAAALNAAALHLGWPNYLVYERAWKRERAQRPYEGGFRITLNAAWTDRKTHRRGIEGAEITLSEPWWDFLTLEQRRHVGTLALFRIDRGYRDRLVLAADDSSKLNAEHHVLKAARLLAFVDVLRFVPATWSATMRGLGVMSHSWSDPAHDHESMWFDPQTQSHVVVNEPYEDRLNDRRGAQAAWLRDRDLEVLTLEDCTVHHLGTVVQLIAKAGTGVLDSLKQRCKPLNVALNRISAIEEFEVVAS